ncbi:MAG: DUF6602 domain-containing protein [Cyanobacteria bacterium J06648_11]
MTDWSLEQLLASLHEDIEGQLQRVRNSFGHPGTKGDASEEVWLDFLKRYLPKRYQAAKAHVVDSRNQFSQQIDVVVFDRQYSPFIFEYQNQIVVPAESVYAVFEAKQAANASVLAYAREKVASVRKLHRTSLPIPHAGGEYPPKPLIPILGGVLAFESDWNPPLGDALVNALSRTSGDEQIDIGCIAAHGHFFRKEKGFEIVAGKKPATAFLLKLIAQLQFSGTVPMIDVLAYADWLSE